MRKDTRMAAYADSVTTDLLKGNYGHNGIYYDTYDEMINAGRAFIEGFKPTGDMRVPRHKFDILNVERPVGIATQASNELREYFGKKRLDATRDAGSPARRFNDFESFQRAFRNARRYNEDRFLWEGDPYTTELE